MRRIWVVALLAGLGAARIGAQDLAFTNANVVDVRAGRILPRMTVLVSGGRITRLAPADSVAVPPNATRIDAAGSYLMPGLADMHAHFARPEDLSAFLAYGVTLVQYLNANAELLDWRDQTASGRTVGPELHPCAGAISVVPDVDSARRVLVNAANDGFDCVKPYDRISDEAFQSLAGEGRRRGMRTVAHIPRNLTWQQALRARPNAIAHAEEFLYSPVTSAAAVDTIIDEMKAGDISLITTIENYATITRQAVELPELLQTPELATYSPVHRRLWTPERNHYARDFKPARIPDMRRRLAFQQDLVRSMDSAGVRILLGTDQGNLFVLPGTSVHDELQRLVLSGLTPASALRSATIAPAEFLGRGTELGSVDVGKQADLVLVYGNPLRDITCTRLIAGVMRNGRWFPRDSIRRMLDVIRARYAAESRFLAAVDHSGVASALLAAAREKYVPDQRALNELAYQFWRAQNDTASARKTFIANARLHPTDWIARGSLGEFLEFAGDTARALTETERALAARPRDRELLLQRERLRRSR